VKIHPKYREDQLVCPMGRNRLDIEEYSSESSKYITCSFALTLFPNLPGQHQSKSGWLANELR
jgi:hypothetical protein